MDLVLTTMSSGSSSPRYIEVEEGFVERRCLVLAAFETRFLTANLVFQFVYDFVDRIVHIDIDGFGTQDRCLRRDGDLDFIVVRMGRSAELLRCRLPRSGSTSRDLFSFLVMRSSSAWVMEIFFPTMLIFINSLLVRWIGADP